MSGQPQTSSVILHHQFLGTERTAKCKGRCLNEPMAQRKSHRELGQILRCMSKIGNVKWMDQVPSRPACLSVARYCFTTVVAALAANGTAPHLTRETPHRTLQRFAFSGLAALSPVLQVYVTTKVALTFERKSVAGLRVTTNAQYVPGTSVSFSPGAVLI